MAAYVPRVFISATSQDLRTYRQAVKSALDVHDIHAVLQENRPPDDRRVVEAIRAWLAPCDVVICLVGFAFGGAPPEEPRRSYTQLEYDLARAMHKPVFVFVARPDCLLDATPADSAEDLANQLEHRRALQQSGILFRGFSSVGELVAQVVDTVDAIRQRAGQRPFHFLNWPDRTMHFVGRERELAELTRALEAREPCLVAIIGLTGQGKTTLALEWLLRPDATFTFDAAIWCTALHGGTFDEFIDSVLAHFEPQFDKRDEPSLDKRIGRVVHWLHLRRYLLVLDGLERWLVDSAEGVSLFVRRASSVANGTHVLFTTRAMTGVLNDLRIHRIALEGLDDAAALQLLRSLGVRDAGDDATTAVRLYRNHPLSLRILGKLAAKEYGGWLSRVPRQAVGSGEVRDLLDEARRALPHRGRAERILQIAAACIESPGTELVAAVMHGASVWSRLPGRVFLPDPGIRPIVLMLQEWQLLTWDSDHDALSLHPVIKEYFAGRLRNEKRVHRAIAHWYADRNRRLAIEHALIAGDVTWCADLLFRGYLDRLVESGDLEEGEALARRLAGCAKGVLRAQLLLAAVFLSHEMSRFRETLADLEECRRIFESAPDDVVSRINLAKTYASRGNVRREVGRSTDAVDDLSRAIDLLSTIPIRREVEPVLAQSYMNRANALLDLGHWTRASADYDAAEKVLSTDFAEARFLRASVLANRGIVRSFQGAFSSAMIDFDRAIELSLELAGEGFGRAAKVLAHARLMRSAAYRECGSPADGVRFADEAIAELEALVSAGRITLQTLLALAYLNRATTHARLRNWVQAASDADTATTIYRQRVRMDKPEMQGSLAHALAVRAEARFHLRDDDGARADRAEAFETLRQLLGEWRGETDIQVVFLETATAAVCYLAEENPGEARTIVTAIAEELEIAARQPPMAEGLRREVRRTTASLIAHADVLQLTDLERRRLSAIGVD